MQASRVEASPKRPKPEIFIDQSFVEGKHDIKDKGMLDITGTISEENVDSEDNVQKTIKITKLNLKKLTRLE